MDGFTEKILDVLIAVVLFFALVGVIITSTTGLNWASVNVGGTITNLSFVPYLIVLVICIGVVVLVYRYILGHKKK